MVQLKIFDDISYTSANMAFQKALSQLNKWLQSTQNVQIVGTQWEKQIKREAAKPCSLWYTVSLEILYTIN